MWETFSARSALDFARAVAPYKPLFIEEPTWRELPDVLGEIAAKSPVPLAGGEGLVSRYEFRRAARCQGRADHSTGCDSLRGDYRDSPYSVTRRGLWSGDLAAVSYYGPIAHIASLHSMMSVRNFLMQEWDAGMESTFADITKDTFPRVINGHVRPSPIARDSEWRWTGTPARSFSHIFAESPSPGGR